MRKRTLDSSLTIAIPTYNRSHQILSLIKRFQPIIENSNIKFLIIDDGSKDDTTSAITNLGIDSENFQLTSRENLGYAQTFLDCLTNASTDWVMVTTDDDDLLVDNLFLIDRLLVASDDSLLVTDWRLKNGDLYRGGFGDSIVSAFQIDQTMHAPGILYRPQGLIQAIENVQKALDGGSEAAYFYPQVIVTAYAVANRAARFVPITLVQEIDALPSALVNKKGEGFYSPESRINQYLSFSKLWEELGNLNYQDSAKVSEILLKANQIKFLEKSTEFFSKRSSGNDFRFFAITHLISMIFRSSLPFRDTKLWLRKFRPIFFIYKQLFRR